MACEHNTRIMLPIILGPDQTPRPMILTDQIESGRGNPALRLVEPAPAPPPARPGKCGFVCREDMELVGRVRRIRAMLGIGEAVRRG